MTWMKGNFMGEFSNISHNVGDPWFHAEHFNSLVRMNERMRGDQVHAVEIEDLANFLECCSV